MISPRNTYNDFPVLAILLEKSFEHNHIYVTVAYKISNYHWAAKTGAISTPHSDEQLLDAVFNYGIPVDPELAINTFQIKDLEFRKFEFLGDD